MRVALVGILLVALLTVPQGMAWNQFRGGPDRNGSVVLPPGPLDVVDVPDLGRDNFTAAFPVGAPVLVLPEGPLFLVRSEATCALVVLPTFGRPGRTVGEIDACEQGAQAWMIAHDAERDLVHVCVGGGAQEPFLIAIRLATGEVAWGVRGADVASSATAPTRWECRGGAFDPARDELVVAATSFDAAFANRVVAVDGDGKVLWSSALPTAGSTGTGPVPPLAPQGLPTDRNIDQLVGRAVTLTNGGVVVLSVARPVDIPDPAQPRGYNEFEANLAMYDRDDGRLTGVRSSGREPGSPQDARGYPIRAASWYAIAKGPVSALAFGGRVMIVNPEQGSVIAQAPIVASDPSFSFIWWTPGAWLRDTIVIPLPHSVSAFDAANLDLRWSWSEGLDWGVRDLLTTADGNLLLLMGQISTDKVRLVALDAATGTLLWELPLPFVASESAEGSIFVGTLVPAGSEGLLVADLNGKVALLGVARDAAKPLIEASNRWPAVSESLQLDVLATKGASRCLVHWGDGQVETAEPCGTLRHAYTTPGPVLVRVTGVRADGTTATTTLQLDVGGTPPPRLSALQRAFAPENENLTFGILGIVLTILGAAFTIGRHRRRFSKLERELAAVEEIRLLSTSDPHGAVVALKAYRDRLPEDLARRRIDDSQYQVLDVRSARLLRVLRTRMFAPFDPRLSMRYHRLLDAAFEDAILQPSERVALVAALDTEEALTPEDRAAIGRILDEFTSHHVAFGRPRPPS